MIRITVVLLSLLGLSTIQLLSQTPCSAPNCDPVPMTDVCSDGTNTVTLSCDASLTNVIWFNSSGVQVGLGCNLTVDNTLVGTGMVGQTECFYYEGDDSSSCPGESCCPVTVTVLNCMTCDVSIDDVSCNGEADGEITAVVTNGVAPFTYVWSNGQTTATAVDLVAGTYMVTVTDAAGGTSVCSGTVTEPPLLTCVTTGTDVSCFGTADGTATVTASGGTPLYSYIWDNGDTNATATALTAGLHTVTITDDQGCELICDITIGTPAELICSLTPTNLLCNDDNTGAIALTVSGGTALMTYDWSNDGPETPDNDMQNLSGLASGLYSVTITDANGCTVICSETLTEPTPLTCSAVATDETDCGAANGTITTTPAGGTPPYSYSVNGGAFTTAALTTGLVAGTYVITTQDANGCTVECTAVVNTPSAPMCTLEATMVSCFNGNDGTITASAIGGSGFYEYSLAGGPFSTTNTFTGLVAGSYTVTVRNTGNPSCTSVCNITITEPNLLECSTIMTATSCNGGLDGTATVIPVGGTPGYTYAWNTNPVQTTPTAIMLSAGTWQVVVTDANGCTTLCNAQVPEPPDLVCSLTGTNITCAGTSDGTIATLASGGTGLYEYSINSGPFSPSNTFGGLAPGNYVVTTRDANGCLANCTIVLTEPDPLSCLATSTDATDCGVDDGTITASTIGGTAPYTFSLNGAPPAASGSFMGLGAGVYTIDIVDANGCTVQCTASVSSPNVPTCSIIEMLPVDCIGNATGSLTAEGADGSGIYEYSIDGIIFQSSGTFAGLVAGSYTITVRNVGNPMCISTCTATITEPEVLLCTVDATNATCPSGLDGSTLVEHTGGTAPFTYLWSDGQTTPMAANLLAGTHTVTVTDANGCIAICVGQVMEPMPLECTVVTTNLTCNSSADGTLTIGATGGTSGYEFSLDGGPFQAGNVFMNLIAGSYIVSVRDINGCLSNCSASISEPPMLTCTVAATDASNCGVDNGALTVTPEGGTAGYLFSLNGGAPQSSAFFIDVSAGFYTIDVIDANGCVSTCFATVNAPSAPMCTIVETDITCNGGSDGILDVTGNGGSGVYEFSLDGITYQSSGLFTGLLPGNYLVTVRNVGQANCTSTCSAVLSEPIPLTCTLSGLDPSCQGGTDGEATVSLTGGTAPFSYVWSTGATTNSISGLAAGLYSIVVTDLNGCTGECDITLMAPPSVSCSLTTMDVTCNNGSDGFVIAQGAGGISPYEFSLLGTPFQTANVFTGLTAGTYIVSIRDANACESSCSVEVLEPTFLSCTTIPSDASDCNIDDGTIEVLGTGGVSAYEYSLNGGAFQTSNFFTGLGSGAYTIIVRDANGCTSECSAIVNAPSAPMCLITEVEFVSCFMAADGSFMVDATGGSGSFEYSFQGGPFTIQTSYTGLAPGNYTITVRNVGNAMCTSTCNVTIVEPMELTCSTVVTDASCPGASDGTATVAATGGIAPYTYVWDDALSQTTTTAINLAAATYTVTVTDVNGCTAICAATVNEPTPVSCSLDIVNADCSTMTPGSITVIGMGGTPNYEFSADGGVTFQAGNVFNNIGPNDYTITIRDANGCLSTCFGTLTSENCNFDLALIKTISSTTPGPYMPGGQVTFDVTVLNQGTVDAFNININDYIPSGLILSDPNWVVTGSTATLISPIATIPPGGQVVETITFTIDPAFSGTSITNNTEISAADDDTDPTNMDPMDIDSTPNSEDGTTPDPNNDDTTDTMGGDDYDPETIVLVPELLSIGSTIFSDNNNNGVQDPGEDSLGSGSTTGKVVTVELYDANTGGLVAVTTTDANGSYFFGNLPAGDYVVEFTPPASLPVSSTPTNTADDQVDGDDNGIQQDTNGDGLTDGVISSPVITLAPGTEPVGEPGKNGGKDSADDANGDMTVDFGLVPLGSIGSTVFSDNNNNGIQDPGEDNIGTKGKTVVVTLLDSAGNVVATTTTDSNGSYVFDNLLPGDYVVEFMPPSSLPLSSTGAGADDGVDEDDNGIQQDTNGDGLTDGNITSTVITLMPGTEPTNEPGEGGTKGTADDSNGDMTIDFGLVPLGSIGSTVFSDDNDNGVQDPGELNVGAKGKTITLTLLDAAGNVVAITTTDANGSYVFDNLPPGDYVVEFVPPASLPISSTGSAPDDGVDSDDNGIQQDTNGDGITDGPITSAVITLTPGTEPTNEPGEGGTKGSADDANGDMTIDFGLVPVPDPELLSIGSTIFSDNNNNGVQDPGEDSLGSGSTTGKVVTVELYDANTGGLVAVTTTDANGSYFFGNLPAGDYVVEFTPPASLPVSSTPTNTADDQVDGDDNGIQQDTNGDGLTDGVISSPVITLAPGTEPVGEPGKNGGKDSADDANGDMTVDFGLVPLGSIGSTVFSDNNNNGIQDPGEDNIGTKGKTVVVTLLDSAGNVVATTTTDSNGSYVFDNLLPGDYVVEFMPPSSLPLSSTGAGADDGVDEDDNGIQQDTNGDGLTDGNITSTVITLMPGTEPTNEPGEGGTKGTADDSNGDMTIDFGLVPLGSIGSTVFSDDNDNGVQDPGELNVGAKGKTITLTLLDAAGNVVAITTTDANGSYVFDNLPPGDYVVEFVPPASLPISSTGSAPDDGVDSDDNGIQQDTNGDGITDGPITSAVITLTPGTEPTNEPGEGGTKGSADDANGDMTIDFGLVPLVEDFDLALIKEVVTPGSYSPGQNVLYDITVCNQGDLVSNFFEITDHIPGGMSLSAIAANSGWVAGTGSGSGSYAYAHNQPLVPGACIAIPITLTIDQNFAGTTLVNEAEISADDGNDIDSTPGVDDGPDTDDVFNDLADDEDPETITLNQDFDLALNKVYTSFMDLDGNGVISSGDNLIFTITVYNQGTIDATSVSITDYVPADLIYNITAATNVANGWGPGPNPINNLGLIPAGSSAQVDIQLQINPAFMGSSIVNDAEITAATNVVGLADEDSTPANNAGSPSELGTDNNIDDEALGTPGTVDNPFDEDDFDPAEVTLGQVFDLALLKSLSASTPGPFTPGSTVTYDVTVFNQGSIDAFNVGVVDYIPVGLTLIDPAWTNIGGVALMNAPIPVITAGTTQSVSITFTIDPNFMGSSITNNAEISAADDDTNPTNTPPTDNDSTPGSENGSIPDPNDGDIADTLGGDDYDPETITLNQEFDLALDKLYSSFTDNDGDGQISAGDDVVFTITVYNQGTVDATSVEVTDYVPADLIYNANSPVNILNGWGPGPNPVTSLGAIPTGSGSGAAVPVQIELQIDPAFMGTSIVNDAEITLGSNNLGLADEDSTPGDNAGTPSELGTDNDINDEAPGTPGSIDNPFDDDDFDPEEILIGQIFDLALVKGINLSTPGPYAPGSMVTYDLMVINQGSLDAFNVGINDYVPAGLTLADAAWTNVGGVATLVSPIATVPAGTTETVSITFTIDANFMGTSITNNAEIGTADNDTDPTNTPPSDIDSTPASEDGSTPDSNDGDTADTTGGDDYDPETIVLDQVFDLALVKNISASTPGPYAPGGTVAYDIMVINQGSIDAFNVNVNDYIPAGLTLADAAWSNIGGVASLLSNIATIPAGTSQSVSITFTIDPAFMGTSITNNAEISMADDDTDITNTPPSDVDSTPASEDGSTPDPNDGDTADTTGGDDYDSETITLVQEFDLALDKVYTNFTDNDGDGQISSGDNLVFTITVYNQGAVDATSVEVTDYIPADLIYNMNSPLNILNGWGAGPNPVTNLGAIATGGTAQVQIELGIDPAFMGTSLVNNAEITLASNGLGLADEDSNPGDNAGSASELGTDNDIDDDGPGTPGTVDNPIDEDDFDPAEVLIGQTFDLALLKTVSSSTPGPYNAGSTVTFDLMVINQGTVDAFNINLNDIIPAGLLLSDASWTSVGGVASLISPISTVAAGTSTTVSITFTIDPAFMGTSITNTAEISEADNDNDPTNVGPTDVDSTPSLDDGPDSDNVIDDGADDEDPETINIGQVYDLALIKTLTAGQASAVAPGDAVGFTITVSNQGTVVANSFEVTDYIPTGFTFNPLANPIWTDNLDGTVTTLLSAANGSLPVGGLAPGSTTTFDIILDVSHNAPQGQDLVNVAEITNDDGDDVDSTPDTDQTNDAFGGDDITDNTGGDEDDQDPAMVTVQEFDLALVKSLAVGQAPSVGVGELVTYTITVYNQGDINADNILIADYLPACMTLSDPNWTGAGPIFYTASVANGDLPLGGLAPGASVSVDLTLLLDLGATSACDLTNVAEIADGTDADGNPISDIDSSPDAIAGNDAFGGDNVIDNTGGDEDDSDPETILLDLIYDLALTKEVTDFIDFNGSGTISQEDDVIFTITVINQGMVNASNIEVTDYIPVGMFLSPNDNNGWIGALSGPVTNTISSIPVGSSMDLQIVLRVDQSFMGSELINWAEISNDDGNDFDSTPDAIQFNGPGETNDLDDDGVIDNINGDEDDHDPALITVGQTFDLALMKTVASGQVGPYDVFDDITYSITVFNQGTLEAHNVEVIDYVQPGQILSPNDVNGWVEDSNGNYTMMIPGPIAPGQEATVNITMRITPEVYILQLDSLSNVAEIFNATDADGVVQQDEDSTADTSFGNDFQMDDVTDNSGGDEDDEDLAFVELEPLDPTGYIYCDKTGSIVTGGMISVTGPGNIIFGIDSEGNQLNGLNGAYQFFVDVAGIYNITYTHPLGFPLSSTCLPLPGTFDPTFADGGIFDRDMIVNNTIVMGSDTLGGFIADLDCTVNNYFTSVDLQPADPPLIEFNNIPVSCVLIQSRVCEDTDLDGNAESTDPGFDGITVSLFSCNNPFTPIASTVTENGGQYSFDGLEAGCYRLFFDVPNGYSVINNPNINSDGFSNDFFVDYGDCYTDGEVCLTMAQAGLGNFVFHDLNGDGIQDFGEPGIPDVRVSLFNENGVLLDIQFTDFMGQYLFDDLSPGHYYVGFEAPEGFTAAEANQGNNDNVDSDVDNSNGFGTTSLVWLDAGELDLSWDAGFHQCVPIGDFLWNDDNENGRQDFVENGINGVKINLWRVVNGNRFLFDTQYSRHKPGTPSDDGYYCFCAPPGTYFLEYEVNNSVLETTNSGQGSPASDSDVTGSNGPNTTSNFTVFSGEERKDLDAGYQYTGEWIFDPTQQLEQESIAKVETSSSHFFSELTGETGNSFNLLEWKVNTDLSEGYYEIQRITDEGTYEVIGRIMSSDWEENNVYTYKDYDLYAESYEYKVTFISYDKEYKVGVINLQSSEQNVTEIQLYPTVTTSYATLKVTTLQSTYLNVSLINIAGEILESDVIDETIDTGVTEYRINAGGLSPGIYTLRISLGQEISTQKLIVLGN